MPPRPEKHLDKGVSEHDKNVTEHVVGRRPLLAIDTSPLPQQERDDVAMIAAQFVQAMTSMPKPPYPGCTGQPGRHLASAAVGASRADPAEGTPAGQWRLGGHVTHTK